MNHRVDREMILEREYKVHAPEAFRSTEGLRADFFDSSYRMTDLTCGTIVLQSCGGAVPALYDPMHARYGLNTVRAGSLQ